MQRFEADDSISEVVPAALPDAMEEGAFCETTNRIVLVSPYPASIRSLLTALTVRCYDVLVFHHENDPVLQSIQSDLLIVDRTSTRSASSSAPAALKDKAVPQLFLVNHAVNAVTLETEGESLQWPCPIEEALRRIERLIRSGGAAVNSSEQLRLKDVVLDLKRFTVQRGDQRVELTRTEFDLFKALIAAGGSVLSRQEIMDTVWGDGYFGGSNSVDVHIKSIRQKLGDDPKKPQYIITVRGIGYRIADE